MSAHQPTNEQVIAALTKSGFLFEQEVASELEAAGFHVETSWPYQDVETKKSREIDLRAVKNILHSPEHYLQVFVELIVECKDSDSPFVFLERNKNKRELEASGVRSYVFPRGTYKKSLTNTSYREVPAFKHLELAQHHYYFKEAAKATQFAKVVRKGSDWVANHDGIYDSVFLPLAKALDARRTTVPTLQKGSNSWAVIWLFFPLVVLRDNLLVLNAQDGGSTIERRGRVTFVRHMDADGMKGDYLVDFVTKPNLSTYIASEVMCFAEAVADIGRGSPSILRGDDA